MSADRNLEINFLFFLNSAQYTRNFQRAGIHPASTTHSQLNAQELAEQEIYPGTVRLSIGTEHINDLIADLEQALAKI